jgi:plasmid stability protein
MASLLIRNVDDALRTQLKARARAHSRSLEEEVREILRTAIANDASGAGARSLMQIAAACFGPGLGIELDLPPRCGSLDRAPPDFSGPEYD